MSNAKKLQKELTWNFPPAFSNKKITAKAVNDYAAGYRDYLDKFAFICLLSFDVYLKKRIIEHIADEMAGNKEDPRAKKKK